MHVDGFRFDLASVFARNDDGSLNLKDPPIFGDILSDPDLSGHPSDRGAVGCRGRVPARRQFPRHAVVPVEWPVP